LHHHRVGPNKAKTADVRPVDFVNIGKRSRPMKVIYKITYPNGKIYVGKDLTAR